MRMNWKKLACLLLSLLLLTVLAACGDESNETGDRTPSTSDKNPGTTQSTPSEPSTPATTVPLVSSEGLKYALTESKDAYVVTGIGTCEDVDLVIPAEYNGLPVTEIGEEAFCVNTNIQSVVLPDTITVIHDNAFDRAVNMVSIRLSKNLVSIGREAFWRCDKLVSLDIPDSVTTILYAAFGQCENLVSVKLPAGLTEIPSGMLCYAYKLEAIEIPQGVTEISPNAFSTCKKLKTIVIPDTVTKIGASAFYDCVALENLTIGSGVTEIAKEAFMGCDALTAVELPDGLTVLGQGAFKGCDSLTTINIPAGVMEVYYVFGGCKSLTSVVVEGKEGWSVYDRNNHIVTDLSDPAAVAAWVTNDYGWYANDYVGVDEQGVIYHLVDDSHMVVVGAVSDTITTAHLKDTVNGYPVTEIADSAFIRHKSLVTVSIPASITKVGQLAFYECEAITSITFEIPNGWTSRYGDPVDVSDPKKNCELLAKKMSGAITRKN